MDWTKELARLTEELSPDQTMAHFTERGRDKGLLRAPVGDKCKTKPQYTGVREWQAELSISRLFRTSIRLQTAFDRCFHKFGMTAQEAAVLVHCAEAGETSAGKLAKTIGRDKGKVTRFVDRLETDGYLTRRSDPRDHRLFIIRVTNKGRKIAPELKALFEEVRAEFFQGMLNVDLDRLETLLSQLHANAERLCLGKPAKGLYR